MAQKSHAQKRVCSHFGFRLGALRGLAAARGAMTEQTKGALGKGKGKGALHGESNAASSSGDGGKGNGKSIMTQIAALVEHMGQVADNLPSPVSSVDPDAEHQSSTESDDEHLKPIIIETHEIAPFTVMVRTNWITIRVKRRISTRIETPMSQMVLKFMGQVLKNNKTLDYYGITEDTHLQLELD